MPASVDQASVYATVDALCTPPRRWIVFLAIVASQPADLDAPTVERLWREAGSLPMVFTKAKVAARVIELPAGGRLYKLTAAGPRGDECVASFRLR